MYQFTLMEEVMLFNFTPVEFLTKNVEQKQQLLLIWLVVVYPWWYQVLVSEVRKGTWRWF